MGGILWVEVAGLATVVLLILIYYVLTPLGNSYRTTISLRESRADSASKPFITQDQVSQCRLVIGNYLTSIEVQSWAEYTEEPPIFGVVSIYLLTVWNGVKGWTSFVPMKQVSLSG